MLAPADGRPVVSFCGLSGDDKKANKTELVVDDDDRVDLMIVIGVVRSRFMAVMGESRWNAGDGL